MSSLRVPLVQRHRKTVSTGGGRAWSDAEEAYLIETRGHKMPYKHIAAQLRKTELACRLHYHQLSFGSKSRRTNPMDSLHSIDRSSMTPPTSLRHPTPQRPLPSFSPPASPENHDYGANNASNNANIHKPILPKPVISPQRAAQEIRSLALLADDMHDGQYVDVARLDQVYDAHRLHFWSTIAHNYGGNTSPTTLEDAWRRAHGMAGSNFPPTPRGSPQSSQAQSATPTTSYRAVTDKSNAFTAINTSKARSPPKSAHRSTSSKQSSFAISSLLTEDKEVRRSPSREQKLRDLEHEYAKATTSATP
ncbi:MAG: hypothetical protein Q9217_005772 [Psora testacea]